MSFDIEQVVREVEAASESLSGEWLPASWAAPEEFTQAVVRYHSSVIAPASKSRLGAGVDLGHDLILRHLPSERAALRWYDRRFGWQALTYNELERRSASRSRSWLAHGVNPGDVVAIVHPVGPELAVSLLAALRLGVVFAFVPPLGSSFLLHRLERLKPVRIASEPLYLPLFRQFGPLVLPQEDVKTAPLLRSASSTYVAGTPMAMHCSPLLTPDAPPVAISGETVWLGAMRDALLTFGLRAEENIAAPGFDQEQHLPGLLFAAWLHGGTYVHLEMDDVEREPALLFAQPLRAIGVTAAMRDVLLNAGARPPKPWGLWFRNPEEPFDGGAWRRFIEEMGMKGTPLSNLVMDSAAGGTVLASRRMRGHVNAEVLPAPGRPWTLIDSTKSGSAGPAPDRQGAVSVTNAGIFVSGADAQRPGHIVLTRSGKGFLFAGHTSARRSGRVYPSSEVCDAVAKLPFVRGALIVPMPAAGVLSQWYFTLVVFTGFEELEAAAKQTGERVEKLNRQVVIEMGAGWLPDRIEMFPLLPRRSKEGVDENWCRMQYLTGALHRKTRDPSFQLLNRLRSLCEADSAPPPASS